MFSIQLWLWTGTLACMDSECLKIDNSKANFSRNSLQIKTLKKLVDITCMVNMWKTEIMSGMGLFHVKLSSLIHWIFCSGFAVRYTPIFHIFLNLMYVCWMKLLQNLTCILMMKLKYLLDLPSMNMVNSLKSTEIMSGMGLFHAKFSSLIH